MLRKESYKYIGIVAVLMLFVMINSFTNTNNFKEEQLKFERVRDSYSEKEILLKKMLAKQQLTMNNLNIFIRIFKQEDVLEIWGKDKGSENYKLLNTYPICSKSGVLGPKRQQGDYQVPEGFYQINGFNPQSNYYLSMMINYPNQSDKILGKKGDLGNLICIHGNCVTIGCIPITDDLIKEVYLLAVEAKNNGQHQIPVHIFPFKLTSENLISESLSNDSKLTPFWKNLKLGYDAFESTKVLPIITVANDGCYHFN